MMGPDLVRVPAQIAVRGQGLNFKDVLNVLGMYPGDPGPPGLDCAAVVTAVGVGDCCAVSATRSGGRGLEQRCACAVLGIIVNRSPQSLSWFADS